ncbi:hypothetical protein KQQSB11_110036 [Klebsiella quasipneumoniae subsp. quasipneumoniae]|nr:hypothetical protein KQQSB11_110036 [Klebsiella quasipneumoniae subsp. quasipneumoniae]
MILCRLSAGWRLSPYPACEGLQYQTVMQLAVGPRKRSAAGQSLKIALCQPFGAPVRAPSRYREGTGDRGDCS